MPPRSAAAAFRSPVSFRRSTGRTRSGASHRRPAPSRRRARRRRTATGGWRVGDVRSCVLPGNGANHIDRHRAVKGPPQRPKTAVAVADRRKGAMMRIRTRKLVGTVALLLLVTVWALLAMAFA